MRFLMIAAALSVAALGFTGCAMTGDGCSSCSATIGDSPCGASACGASSGDCGCGDASMGQTDTCDCGGVGCNTCSQYGRRIGMHNAPSDGSYGGGLSETEMAMPLFTKGAACGGGNCGPRVLGGGRLGSGQLISRLRSLGCKDGCACDEGCDGGCGDGEVIIEDAGATGFGLLSKLKNANAIAMAEQEAAFEVAQADAAGDCGPGGCIGSGRLAGGRAGGCGRPGCGGPGGCAACARGIAQFYHGQPYGGQVPHTTPPPAGAGGAGMAPTYAYPYYTTRGPRDFLQSRPMDIGY